MNAESLWFPPLPETRPEVNESSFPPPPPGGTRQRRGPVMKDGMASQKRKKITQKQERGPPRWSPVSIILGLALLWERRKTDAAIKITKESRPEEESNRPKHQNSSSRLGGARLCRRESVR